MSGAAAVVENPRRTAQYLALVAERRSQLRNRLAVLIPPGSDFVWEVGCGHGHFLAAYAKVHPEKLCVGIDHCERPHRPARCGSATAPPCRTFTSSMRKRDCFSTPFPRKLQTAEIFILFSRPVAQAPAHRSIASLQPKFLDQLARPTPRSGCRLCFRNRLRSLFLTAARAAIMLHPKMGTGAGSVAL